MSWRDGRPTWTSSDPEFTSLPSFLWQHQRPNSSTFPSLSENLNWILIIEEKCPLRYKKLYELLCPAGARCCYRRFEVTITAWNALWLFFYRFWAMRTSWLWSQWGRRMLASTCAVLWSHVWERVKKRFLSPSMVGFIFLPHPGKNWQRLLCDFAQTNKLLSLLHIQNKRTNPCCCLGLLRRLRHVQAWQKGAVVENVCIQMQMQIQILMSGL